MSTEPLTIPPGLCQCGCGATTTIARSTANREGVVKGQSRRFIQGHRIVLHPALRMPVGAPGACWPWPGQPDAYGYGRVKIDGRMVKAHRFAYTLRYGPIPEGLCVLHRCDNRPCCNPEHLFLGSHADNVADMNAKGRRGHAPIRSECQHGHPYTDENTYVSPLGARVCRSCNRAAAARYKAKGCGL